MDWFAEKIDPRTKTLVTDVTEAYVERAHLTFQLLSLSPRLSDIELAVFWFGAAEMMHKAAAGEGNELLKGVDQVACTFFDTFCQNYVEFIVDSALILDLTSPLIQERISPTLQTMPAKRLEIATEVIGKLTANAWKLSGSTLSVLTARFTSDQGVRARRYASSLLKAIKNLNSFERAKAKEWLKSVEWSVL